MRKKPMAIVHVVSLGPFDELGLPGPFNVALQQCRELSRVEKEVRIVTTHVGGPPERNAVIDGVQVQSFRRRALVKRRLATIFSIPLWAQVLRLQRSSNVFHLHVSRDLIFVPLLILIGRRVDVVCQPHGQVESTSTIRGLLDSRFVGPLMARRSRVLALQEVERENLIAMGVKAEQVVIVANRIRLPDINYSVRSYQTPNRLAFIAHLRPEKRVDLALKLSAALFLRGFDHELVVAGPDGGDLRLVVDGEVERSSVSYVGVLSQPEVRQLLSSVSALLLCADREPFGMSLIEGLSLGTPAICGPGVFAAANLGENNGVLRVDYGDMCQTATQVADFLSSEARWLAASSGAIEHSRREFDAKKYPEVLRAIYSERRV